ncbi:hypothetical protein [Cloacibacterium normanense]
MKYICNTKTINQQPTTINQQPSIINHQPSTIYRNENKNET